MHFTMGLSEDRVPQILMAYLSWFIIILPPLNGHVSPIPRQSHMWHRRLFGSACRFLGNFTRSGWQCGHGLHSVSEHLVSTCVKQLKDHKGSIDLDIMKDN